MFGIDSQTNMIIIATTTTQAYCFYFVSILFKKKKLNDPDQIFYVNKGHMSELFATYRESSQSCEHCAKCALG